MCSSDLCGSTKITYQGTEIDMGRWERLTMVEAVKKYSGADYSAWESDEAARACAKELHVEVPAGATKGTVLAELFDAFVEEKLIQPTIIYDYPVEISPLAKRKPEDPAFTERFEYFICAREMGNAFSELNDPIDQRQRFESQVAAKRAQEPNTKAEVVPGKKITFVTGVMADKDVESILGLIVPLADQFFTVQIGRAHV